MAEHEATDRVVRAMTQDGAFRVITAITTETVTSAAKIQGASGDAAARLAELMTGAILLREAMAPDHRLQVLLRSAGGGTVIADALPGGLTRGLVNPGSEQPIDLDSESTMQVSRTLANGDLHQGIVSVPADGTISDALMRYLQESEQVFSVIAVDAPTAGPAVRTAGGYLVQLLPGAPRDALEEMTSRLTAVGDLAPILTGDPDAADLLGQVLGEIEHSALGEEALRFGCNCSPDRVRAGLASLGGDELRDMLAEGKDLDIRCDACGQHYRITPDELAEIIEP
jgi:molecular chaperone Hsp33